MMMKKILGVTALAAGVLVTGVVLVTAGPQGPARQGRGEGRGEDGRLQRMTEYLGLTEDQQTAWKSLQEQHKAEMQPLMEEGRELHDRLKAATEAENPDPAAVGAATLALKQHREKARASQQAFTEKLAGTLTPEQKTRFEAFQASHRGGYGKHAVRGQRGARPGRHKSPPAGEAPAAPTQG